MVTNKKVKVGEVCAQENSRGICIMKWRDKRDVLLLSTKNTDTCKTVHRRTGDILKPQAILDYNEAKSSIDVSDQMASYNSALRRSLKWYRKLAIELLWGTTLVNAHFLYRKITNKNTQIGDFREQIVESFLFDNFSDEAPDNISHENVPGPSSKKKRLNAHSLAKKDGPSHNVRKYCKGCYEKKKKGEISKNNVSKVVTYCKDCVGEPHFCIECFSLYHC